MLPIPDSANDAASSKNSLTSGFEKTSFSAAPLSLDIEITFCTIFFPSDDDKKCFEHVNEGVQGLSLGSGKAPVKAVRDWALKNGVFMVVESEGLQPTGLEEVKRCIDYLESIE